MKNWIQNGDSIDVVAGGGGLVGGAFYNVGGVVGVVASTAASGVTVPVRTKGVFKLAKASGQAWVAGDPLYWDAGNSRFTKTFGAGVLPIAFAAAAAASADVTGAVALGFSQGAKTVCGQHTTVTATDTVVTGLALVLSAVASYETDIADANNHVQAAKGNQSGAPAAGSIIVKTWRTDGTDPTPLAANAFGKLVNWIAVGF